MTCKTVKRKSAASSFSSLLHVWCFSCSWLLFAVFLCLLVMFLWCDEFTLFPQRRRHYLCNLGIKKQQQKRCNFTTLPRQELPCVKSQISSKVSMVVCLLYRSHRSASLTSGLHSNATRVIPDNSDKDLGCWGEERRLQKKKKRRRQLQIYTSPLDHCTSLKPEAASSGSVSVPAHTGCTRPPTRWFISAVVLNVFPRPERWELMRFTHVCREIHFWGKRTCNSSEGKERRSPTSLVSNHTASATVPRQDGGIGDGCSPLHCL